ncbi:hypothetical protein FDZ73_19680 [bacterium]|nr:MAG: hypothetical protein FDZ73_19680 [bacterium]
MADQAALRTRMQNAIMPGRTAAEYDAWLTEATTQHGYATFADVPTNAETAICYHARYLGLSAKAAETAENAAITVPDKISINKTSASGNYDRQIKNAWRDYIQAANKAGIAARLTGGVQSGSFVRADKQGS